MIPEDKWFYFSSGRKASNILELKEALEGISEAEFRHHVGSERNDFANWVENVFEEKKLARSMREVSEKDGLIIILEDFLKRKKSRKKPKKSFGKIKRLVVPKERRLSPEPERYLTEKEAPEREASEKEASEKEVLGKDLSEKELKGIVSDAKQVFEKEKIAELEKEHLKPLQSRFIVKEFIYGFLLGLIFGLIMLGILLNLRF